VERTELRRTGRLPHPDCSWEHCATRSRGARASTARRLPRGRPSSAISRPLTSPNWFWSC